MADDNDGLHFWDLTCLYGFSSLSHSEQLLNLVGGYN